MNFRRPRASAACLVLAAFALACGGESPTEPEPDPPDDGQDEDPPPAELSISSVSPSPIPEGGSFTIEGEGMGSDASAITVTVDGAEAEVTSVDGSSLEATAPTFDCLPARDVDIEVQVSGSSASVTEGLEPDETPVSLEVGQQRLIQSSGLCAQFEAGSEAREYLMGFQSLATGSPGALTRFQVTSEAAGDGSSAASMSPVQLTSGSASFSGDVAPRVDPRLDAHRRSLTDLRQWERENLDPTRSLSDDGSGTTPGISAAVAGGTTEGETVALRVPDATASAACETFTEIDAEVMAKTEDVFVLADTGNPSGGYSDADYQAFADRLQSDVLGPLTSYFGEPSDTDGNGRVVVLITKEVNAASPETLGFTFAGDLSSRSSCAASDEGEIFYGRAPDPDGSFGEPYPTDQARADVPLVLAHQVTHVIQNGARSEAGQSFLDAPLAEAQATFAEEIVGHAVTGRSTGQNYGPDVAFNTGGGDEVGWYARAFDDLGRYFGGTDHAPEACGWWRSNPSPCPGRALWHGTGWSFLRWVSDHFGPDHAGGEQGLQQELITASGSGIEKVADVVGVPFEELMAQWAASHYVDDRVPEAETRLTVPSWNLFDIQEASPQSATLEPETHHVGFTDWQGVDDLRASSSSYLLIEGSDRAATAMRARTPEGGTLPSTTQVWIVRIQ